MKWDLFTRFAWSPKKSKTNLLWLWKGERISLKPLKINFISSSWFPAWLTSKIFSLCSHHLFIWKNEDNRRILIQFSLSVDVSIVGLVEKKNFKEMRNLVTWQFNTFFSRKETHNFMSSLLHVTKVENLRKSEIDTSVILRIVDRGRERKWKWIVIVIYLTSCSQTIENIFVYDRNFLVKFLLLKFTFYL